MVSFLEKKAEEEDLNLYLMDIWFNQVRIIESYRQQSLESILSDLLPRLGLRSVFFDPDHIIVVKDLAHGANNTLNQSDDTPQHEARYSFDLSKEYTVNGMIRDNKNDEGIIGATIYVNELESGTITNELGQFSLTLPSNLYHLNISALGFDSESIELALVNDTTLSIILYDKTTQLQEIIISDEAVDRNVTDIAMGTNRLNIKTLRRIPPMMGEVDVIRSLMLLPGITTVGEGATSYNVRGGSVDQNLVLLDEAPIFNSSHFFGFFTAFNSNAIKDVTISKGGIPAQYGGRISSILDVKLRQGNNTRIKGEGGVGLISSHLLLDGPIVKDKTTFLLSGRLTYSDWYLKYLPGSRLQNSNAYFHDFIGRISHKVNPKNSIFITGYTSNDNFQFPGDTVYGWSNHAATFKWSNSINPRSFMVNSLVFSDYRYLVNGLQEENAFRWQAGIQYLGLKSDLTYNPDIRHKIDMGVNLVNYRVRLGDLYPNTAKSNINPFTIDPEISLEGALYYNHEYRVNTRLTIMGGLRYSHFTQIGPGTNYYYDPGMPKSNTSLVTEEYFGAGEIMSDYGGFEPRLSVRYGLAKNSSIKASYNRMRQYLHLISNTSAVSPIDIWKLSDHNIEPQVGDQVSLGIFKNLKSNVYESSVEVFYKNIKNNIDYKDGAEIVLNPNLETELLNGTVQAYGAEFLIRRNKGRLNGWIAYTLSRAERTVKGNFPEETINSGNPYPVNYDKLHDLAVVGNYDFTRRHSLGFNFVLYSGRPITYPTGSYGISGFYLANFELRNQERIPVYHRLDLSLTIDGSHKKDKKWHGSWTFSIYNLYARKNPYSIFFKARGFKVAQAYRLSVIGTAIPSITYNFNF